MKDHKGKLILSSLLVLLPLAAGLMLWNRLPAQLPMNWIAAGEIAVWGSRLAWMCLMPLFLLVIHWVCVGACFIDPKNKEQNRKALGLAIWICPVVSLLTGYMTLATALGMGLRIEKLVLIFLGLLFIVIGNYLPKCKQNYTIGIRVMWALDDEENWTATHRFASRLWVGCGVVILLLAFLTWAAAGLWISLGLVLAASLASVLYSYVYYRKKYG